LAGQDFGWVSITATVSNGAQTRNYEKKSDSRPLKGFHASPLPREQLTFMVNVP
jgi:hypothetical protein